MLGKLVNCKGVQMLAELQSWSVFTRTYCSPFVRLLSVALAEVPSLFSIADFSPVLSYQTQMISSRCSIRNSQKLSPGALAAADLRAAKSADAAPDSQVLGVKICLPSLL